MRSKLVQIAALVTLSYIGSFIFYFISSGYSESLIAGTLGTPGSTSVLGRVADQLNQGDSIVVKTNADSRYMVNVYVKHADGEFYLNMYHTIGESLMTAFAQELWYGEGFYFQPFFVLPLMVYIALVAIIRLVIRASPLQLRVRREIMSHLLVSLLWTVLIVWIARFSVMVWSNPKWGVEYMRNASLGMLDDGLLYLLVGVAFVYVVWVTADPVCLRRFEKLKCMQCGYELGKQTVCPECGSLSGTQLRKTGRVRLSVFVVLLVMIFFSPVLASSAYRILS